MYVGDVDIKEVFSFKKQTAFHFFKFRVFFFTFRFVFFFTD